MATRIGSGASSPLPSPPPSSSFSASTTPICSVSTVLADRRPFRTLVLIFVVYKSFLLAVAGASVLAGPAYDTSGSLLHSGNQTGLTRVSGLTGHYYFDRLTSWDAIYFVQSTRRGYLFEQEWAFGCGLPTVVSFFKGTGLSEPVLAVAVAHVAHLLSVLVLCRLGQLVWTGASGQRTAFVAAVLHILSPAGLFLSAPYAESSFALFSFAGHLAFAAGVLSDRKGGYASRASQDQGQSQSHRQTRQTQTTQAYQRTPTTPTSQRTHGTAYTVYTRCASLASHTPPPSLHGDLFRLLAGVLYGLASTFRSNGLLNGLLFAMEAIVTASLLVATLLSSFSSFSSGQLFRRLAILGLGGVAVAAGTIVPQAVAYRQFCLQPSGIPGEDFRPWCKRTLPSIYAFVQAEYWNTGLFKYWTLSNLPLFLLAAPMLSVLALSTWDTLFLEKSASEGGKESKGEKESKKSRKSREGKEDGENREGRENRESRERDRDMQPVLTPLVCCLAAAQLLLAVLAFTSYHVQIITRLSSGYPVWYWWLARHLGGGPRTGMAGYLVGFMVMYASIQAVLFASFLPPA